VVSRNWGAWIRIRTVPTVRTNDSVRGGKVRGQSVYWQGFHCARGLTSFLRNLGRYVIFCHSDTIVTVIMNHPAEPDLELAANSSQPRCVPTKGCPALLANANGCGRPTCHAPTANACTLQISPSCWGRHPKTSNVTA